VVDLGTNSLLAFQNASTVTGNASPTARSRELHSAEPTRDAVLDGTRMYISNGSGWILRFEGISALTETPRPTPPSSATRQSSATTQLAMHVGFDELYVDNAANSSILVFASARPCRRGCPHADAGRVNYRIAEPARPGCRFHPLAGHPSERPPRERREIHWTAEPKGRALLEKTAWACRSKS